MNIDDVAFRLSELRILAGMTQDEVAALSGVNVKSLSSFETGRRITSMKLIQLQRLLKVYGYTERDFFR